MRQTLFIFFLAATFYTHVLAQTITDSRDGETYRTVKIGSTEWFAENLRYNVSGSQCLNGQEKYCPLGRYYQATMLGKACPDGWRVPTLPEVVCVLDNDAKCIEVNGKASLVSELGNILDDKNNLGTALKSTALWNKAENVPEGTDKIGFTAIPMGSLENGKFNDVGGGAYFWTITKDRGNLMYGAPDVHMLQGEADPNAVYAFFLFNDSKSLGVNTYSKKMFFTIRCVKDDDSFDKPQTSASSSSEIAPKLKDERNGKIYNTVIIGNDVWMAENLNYKTANSSCYENLDAACDTYGRLYNWDDALSACPEGWRLPQKNDVINLVKEAEKTMDNPDQVGVALKSKTGWNDGNGTDNVKFSAKPSGSKLDENVFMGLGFFTSFWTATETSPDKSIFYGFFSGKDNIQSGSSPKDKGFSVRCVRESK